MQAFPRYQHMSPDFWALVKFLSQTIGYTQNKAIRVYSEEEVYELLREKGLIIDPELIKDVTAYCHLRAATLNEIVQFNLMDLDAVKTAFEPLHILHQEHNYLCNLPMNKQKGDKRNVAFFTAIINILAEKTIRESHNYNGTKGFNDNPKTLIYVYDKNHHLVGASSRIVDGIYPDTKFNPKIVWEIKEYYYTTSFGSRVADGVYETQLDGYELSDISHRSGNPIKHVLFIDGYRTWWQDGKSYLCRIFDILHAGLVDEVIFGREVLTRWPEVLRSVM